MRKSFVNRLNSFLLFLFLFVGGLYIASDFLIPVIIAALIASLCLPLCERLEGLGLGKIAAVICCLLLIVTGIAGFALLFYKQVIDFISDMPSLERMAMKKFQYAQFFIEDHTSITIKQQMAWLSHKYAVFIESGEEIIQEVLLQATHFFALLGLIIVYLFFFLLYRDKFKIFILKFFKPDQYGEVNKIIGRIHDISKDYFTGVLMVMVILGSMHTLGLIILGIDYAFFLGYLAASLIILPYVGTIMGSILAITVALLTKDSMWYAFGVAGIFTFNLFVENNLLTPVIIGSKVKVNPLAIVIAIILGSMLWGIAGMILFIPLLGMIKIICDNVPSLVPFGFLLEDENNSGINYQWVKRSLNYIKMKTLRTKN
jgi:AI-2 transport protein TqsA